YSVVVISMLLAAAATAAEPSDSTYDGQSSSGSVLHHSHAPCGGGETVLVIQDTVEWFAPDDPRGNVVTELIAQGTSWCGIHSNDLAGATLTPFGDIIIPSAQNQAFYNNLFPGGVIEPNLNDWVVGGGVLSANLADHAMGPGAGGNWDGAVFVGGVQHVVAADDFVNIANAAHPIITGTAPCPSGNCGAIADTGPFTDLDDWSFSTHGYFTMVPEGTDVILVDPENRPVMIEYPYGSGVVIATMTTSEYMYGGRLGQDPGGPFNKKLLANEIAYQEFLVSGVITVDLDIKPNSFPNSINTKSRGRTPVAILSSPTFDAPAEVDKSSLTFGRTGDEASLAFCTKGNEDVNDDGLVDVVCHFYNQTTGFQIGDTEGVLKGVTQGGLPFGGVDSVRIVK
ncbi:MAG: hypothetical protein O7D97_10295, partial [Planctomycetota bacterium]|nr:hypothetical protein [Planctomycetota bacterium]